MPLLGLLILYKGKSRGRKNNNEIARRGLENMTWRIPTRGQMSRPGQHYSSRLFSYLPDAVLIKITFFEMLHFQYCFVFSSFCLPVN
jgi:hypothetical protein